MAAGLRFYPLLVGFLPLVLVGWSVLTYAVNLPYWDDFQIQEHLLMLKRIPMGQKLKHLFDQHWEHRIVWTRLLFAGYAKLNGTLNYYGLTLIGVSGLLVVVGVLFAQFRRLAYPLRYFIPVPFLVFTLQSYENLVWAMASIQNFWVIAFAFGTFYALARDAPPTRLLALDLAAAATFTSGNGPLALIVGLIMLAYQRRWRFLIVWGVVALLLLVGYFVSYNRIGFFPSPFRYSFLDWVQAFFVLLGGFADASANVSSGLLTVDATLGLATVLGILVVTLATIALFTSFRQFRLVTTDKPSAFFLGCLLFLLATAAMTVYSRVGFAGPLYMLQSRYKIYSGLTLSVGYLFCLYQWPNRKLRPYYTGYLLLSVGQSLISDYFCLEGLVNQRRRVRAEYINYLANTPVEKQVSSRQVFVPTEPPLFSQQLASWSRPAWVSAPTATTVDRVQELPNAYIFAKVDAVNPTLWQPDNGSYIFLKSPARLYLFAAQPVRTTSAAWPELSHYFTSTRFEARILKEKLAPGTYRIGVITHGNGQVHLEMTDRSITFTPL
ncbi:hypothetical protein [Spirosoma koreense]